ncbi:MAG: radical SAM protein, partial [Halobacteriota archaeon]|nr:radical SAM protein [Halobacteriota archaeon]
MQHDEDDKDDKPDEEVIFAPCETGGCLSCALEIDVELMPSCTTPLKEGMVINTRKDNPPKRLVQGFNGHGVGGVGTPWQIKEIFGFVEVACFTSGCNFRCPKCQNWVTTYRKRGTSRTPRSAAEALTEARERFSVDRMAISGGESTLNREWLTSFVGELKRLNRDEHARIHVDTNGSILTCDYIDDLIEAGTTDIGIDLKSLDITTFIKITGVEDKVLAMKYQ